MDEFGPPPRSRGLAPAPSILDRLTPEAECELLERVHGEERAQDLLARVLIDRIAGVPALVSSFGADSAVLLHMVAMIDPRTPVVFIDTFKLFDETLAYRDELVDELGLTEVRTVTPEPLRLKRDDPEGLLHRSTPDDCCRLRKVLPLEAALVPFDAWISGRRRNQAATRERLPRFEPDGNGRLKINPLAAWRARDVADYRRRHDLPPHPLAALGYKSIGCAPCTTPVRPGEDDRAGRWRGQAKTECGIHFVDGRWIRSGGTDVTV